MADGFALRAEVARADLEARRTSCLARRDYTDPDCLSIHARDAETNMEGGWDRVLALALIARAQAAAADVEGAVATLSKALAPVEAMAVQPGRGAGQAAQLALIAAVHALSGDIQGQWQAATRDLLAALRSIDDADDLS